MAAGAAMALVMTIVVAAGALVLFGIGPQGDALAGAALRAAARKSVPPALLPLFRRAAATCPGLPWSVLAAIGRVESDFGANSHTSSAGAVGMMQFLPATFAAYALPVPAGGVDPPTPYDPTDAVYAAARDLCADGARGGVDIPGAVYAYNHSQDYVARVLSDAAAYASPPAAATYASPSVAATTVVDYSLAQVGTPYRWGGEVARVGFDCSGLTQAAYAAAGVVIPRTSEAQWSALPHLPLDQMHPGDLVFFNPGEFLAGLPGHVGIYVGGDQMVDAPHAGATVRVESLANWTTPMGAARPSPNPAAGSS